MCITSFLSTIWHVIILIRWYDSKVAASEGISVAIAKDQAALKRKELRVLEFKGHSVIHTHSCPYCSATALHTSTSGI